LFFFPSQNNTERTPNPINPHHRPSGSSFDENMLPEDRQEYAQ
jgi:hypothetical protein